MSSTNSNHLVNPAAREAMDKFKMEAAAEVGVNLKDGYNGELTSRQAGSVGGQMVKKMIEAYEKGCGSASRRPAFSVRRVWDHISFFKPGICLSTKLTAVPRIKAAIPCSRQARKPPVTAAAASLKP